MEEPKVPLATTITEIAGSLGRALRTEVRRTMMSMVATLAMLVLAGVVAVSFVIFGAIRLGDALARACGRWVGDPVLGDALVGLTMLVVPLIGVLVLRWRAR